VAVVAQGAGSLPLSGAASGVVGSAPALGVVSGSLSVSGLAVGRLLVKAQSTGSLPLGGAASGSAGVVQFTARSRSRLGLSRVEALASRLGSGQLRKKITRIE